MMMQSDAFPAILKSVECWHMRGDKQKLQALAFVGDCVEEKPADLCAIADELGKRDVRLFIF